MKMGFVVGAALALAPAVGLAQQNQPSQPNQNAPAATQGSRANEGTAGSQADTQQPDLTTTKLLPKDAKLVGTVQSTDMRAFPEQMGKGEQATKIQKEAVVGVGALDRVWTTKQSYKQVVNHLDQKLKGEGIEALAKTTTQSSTAWNVRMPDGHIANLVVRNTQPTTIESAQAAAVMGTVTGSGQQQQMPSSKSKNDNSNTDNKVNNE
jgi:opacity protein-like surface antigen